MGAGIYTSNGEDAESVTYRAQVIDGKMQRLEQTEYDIKPALPTRELSLPARLTDEEVSAYRKREQESLLGRTLYVMYGGQEDGYLVEVIAENDKELVIRLQQSHKWKESGGFEILDRGSRDSTFFDSEEDARSHKKERSDKWDAEKQRYEEHATKWHVQRQK